MKDQRIVIAGGTGFIGQEICNYFGKENQVIILTRKVQGEKNNAFGDALLDPNISKNIQYVEWDGKTAGRWIAAIDGADLLINLSGHTVNCRYTDANKQ